VISGGQETVLNIWQMETNRKQDLPHLTSSIQRLTVSPSGTSYALRLADNSVIVLSTSELKPKAVMSSIQSRSSTDIHKWLDKDLNILQTAAIENRLSPNQILVAVPASSDGFAAGQAPPTPFLQTFDISVGRHVSRQALTRNNAINVDKGGSGNKIEEANVYMMQTTADGLWLATAEEWMPPATDICSLIGEPDINSIQKELEERRETFLKFWKWDSIKNQWGLHARVDSPHVADSEPYINRILDLVAFPDRTGFATIGEDRMIRLWRPKSRLKDGTIIRGVVKDSLTTWSCSKSMELERIAIGSELEEDTGKFEIPRRAKLAISADGSVLAVSLNDTQEFEPGLKAPGLTHFYDCDTGERKFTSPDLYIRDLAGMQFLGQHLIILSEDLHVWDMVSNKLKFGYNLYQNGGRPQGPLRLLAANEKLGTFAVAFTRVNDVEVSTRILVFDTTSAKPLLLTDLPGVVTALMSSDSTSGFITIDAEAEVRLIQPTTNQTILPHMLGQATDSVTEEDEIMGDADDESDVEVIEDTSAGAADIEGSDDESDVDMDRPVIRGNQLAKLFEGTTSHALPPVQDLFHAVAKLYIGRAGVK
jgi:NET1-associated nuclear protein 1 (U3 small nucleolar RNA-associated protein 17)